MVRWFLGILGHPVVGGKCQNQLVTRRPARLLPRNGRIIAIKSGGRLMFPGPGRKGVPIKG